MSSATRSALSMVQRPLATDRPGRANRKTVCCHDKGRCPNAIRWIIDHNYYCLKHAELFWDKHYVEDHKVIRIERDGDKFEVDRIGSVENKIHLVTT